MKKKKEKKKKERRSQRGRRVLEHPPKDWKNIENKGGYEVGRSREGRVK